MRIIYCDSVISATRIEPDYDLELKAALEVGFTISLISFEEVSSGNINKAVEQLTKQENPELAIYRGWMFTIQEYALLYNSLKEKNIFLINDPKAYKHCHYLPESYHKVKGHTPISFWSEPNAELDDKSIIELASNFGSTSIIVKDYVKSEKYSWEEACFIPNASDTSAVLKVAKRFLELRGDSLNAGIVFRAFEKLEYITNHRQSGMPLTKEFRIFFSNGEVLALLPYWDDIDYGNQVPPLAPFIDIARTIESSFFTMDIAQKTNGTWIIMELGDGQVAGLPDNADVPNFYRGLQQTMQQWQK